MALTPRKCVHMNTDDIYQAPAGRESQCLVLGTMTKEEPRKVVLSLRGERRQACVKSDTQLIETKDTGLGVGCSVLEGPDCVCGSVWASFEDSLLDEAQLVPATPCPW